MTIPPSLAGTTSKAGPAATAGHAADRLSIPVFFIAALLHVGLALLLYVFRPQLPTYYAFAIVFIGLMAFLQKSPVPLIYVCAYVAGAELVWRMTKADVFWEMGKYFMVLLMGLGILRWRLRLYGMGIIYFLLLVPGILLTLDALPLSMVRDAISFNMSGPLCLAVAANYLHNIKLEREQVGGILLVSLLPIISVSTLALRSTLASSIIFVPESNFATSGGFGPNQISAILGLGVLLGWLYLFVGRPTGARWWLIVLLNIGLGLQAVLTLSRGGVLNLAFAIPAATFFLMRGGRNYRRVLVLLLFMVVAFSYALPRLDAWTGGVIQLRYNDLSTTGRDQLIKEDIRIWQENPAFGVGAGVSPLKRRGATGMQVASHTEYSRLLAEHGVPGILSILMLVMVLVSSLSRARGGLSQGLVAGLMIWSLAEMSHAAMRIAAISFFFALPLAALYLEEEKPQ